MSFAGVPEFCGEPSVAKKFDAALAEEVGCAHRVIDGGHIGGHVGRRAPVRQPGAMDRGRR